jgi:hypothetical protein
MASLSPDEAVAPAPTMAVLRQPGGEGAIDLSFATVGDEAPVLPVAVRIDDRRLALPALNGPPARATAMAMANGRTLAILEQGDRPRARLSLVGASAALRWIDAQQGRAGGVTALVAKGPATALPPRRSAPIVRAVAADGIAAVPTPAHLRDMRRQAACEDPPAAEGEVFRPQTHALGRGATLVMLPCAVGAYNLSSTLFVLRDGKVAPARADAPTGFAATPAAGVDRLPSVVNGRWENGELTSDAKGRGLGDCGVRQTFVWDGERLRLTEQSEMRECRGNPNYIVTWRAQVVRD